MKYNNKMSNYDPVLDSHIKTKNTIEFVLLLILSPFLSLEVTTVLNFVFINYLFYIYIFLTTYVYLKSVLFSFACLLALQKCYSTTLMFAFLHLPLFLRFIHVVIAVINSFSSV